jgi:hypothetical protein
MIYINDNAPLLNKLIANGKRFLAYDIVQRLRILERNDILAMLVNGVKRNELLKGKRHQIFRLSFDARPCYDVKMIEQKLDYIHANPVMGKWQLVNDYVDYQHSSAGFYETGKRGYRNLTHYKDVG